MASESESSPNPDWSNLPSITVQQISDQLKSLTDFIRFRSVHPSWRSASLPIPRHLPPQIPWLMIPYNPHKDKNPKDDSIRLFYDFSESKMHEILLPETKHMMCCASSKGWLVLVAEEGTDVVLLNPLTRKKITLPNFTTPVKIFGYEYEQASYDAFYWFVPLIGNFVITKVVFSTDPTETGCVIMVFLQKTCRIFFCRVGDPCWTMVNQDPEEIRTEKPSDGTLCNDKFYLLAHDGFLRVYDLNAPKKQLCCAFEPDFQFCPKFFLEGKNGVFLVAIHGGREGNEDDQEEKSDNDDDQENQEESSDDQENQESDSNKKAVEIYQILDDPDFHLKPIRNTINTTIFRGDNHHYLSLNSKYFDSVKGDCLYVAVPCEPSDRNRRGKDGEMAPPCYGIFTVSLEDGKGEKVVGDLGERPCLWPSAPVIWFQPSLV